ncbi:hypothetical protein CFC21_043806 [Triticum aestivum]|uniref:Knottins-like domain-containing protein n=3 Tax=Triticum TaxID=4564 RepID=A0A9R1FPQ7_WHEAT|nr:defensin-like protein [Triticum dicoccoides]XP_044345370.1 defensin-like protein [Triticum aestivum]KAF7032654.1 hypothetical protein CFC21_043806 [Triticum aestivum]CDM86025.1 unnamed protein product [Triticum aestivum]VAH84238.1 unnamed protein product [Triticum turgidum subsp. durum]
MGFNRAQLFAAFALGLLIMSHSVEAVRPRPRICHSPSHLYHGSCNNRKCVEVCHHEHFTGGYCSRKGVVKRLHCECTIKCGHYSPPPPSEVPEPPPYERPPPPPRVM